MGFGGLGFEGLGVWGFGGIRVWGSGFGGVRFTLMGLVSVSVEGMEWLWVGGFGVGVPTADG